MGDSARRKSVIYIVDLLMALAVFFFCRYSGGFPRWYWLVASGFGWVLIGIVTHKLEFDEFRRAPVAIFCIILLDVLSFVLVALVWRLAFPERCDKAGMWHIAFFLTLCEILFYLAFRRIVQKKIPFLYEDVILDDKCEPAVERGIKFEDASESFPEEVRRIYDATKGKEWKDSWDWMDGERDNLGKTLLLDTVNPDEIVASRCNADPEFIVVNPRFNYLRNLNGYLAFLNYKLSEDGYILLHGQTSGSRKEQIYRENPSGLNHIIYALDYIWNRVFPKLHITRWLYVWLSEGSNMNLPRVEILGRLCRAGFLIESEEIREGEFIVVARKNTAPVSSEEQIYGPVVRLKRIGFQGKTIGVLKFRTMYAYSEYLQKYAYERQGLQSGGKINSDFRVNLWGKILRSVWLDELPMLVNLICGDIKLVGVRPLSEQYFSLYSPQMQQLRISVKPGLIPPFYYDSDSPETIEDIQENERRYIESYKENPFRTDCRYLFGCMKNIIFKHRRSK